MEKYFFCRNKGIFVNELRIKAAFMWKRMQRMFLYDIDILLTVTHNKKSK